MDKIRQLGMLGSNGSADQQSINNIAEDIESLFAHRDSLISHHGLVGETDDSLTVNEPLPEKDIKLARESFAKWQKERADKSEDGSITSVQDHFDQYYAEYIDEKAGSFLEAYVLSDTIATPLAGKSMDPETERRLDEARKWTDDLQQDYQQTLAQLKRNRSPIAATESRSTTESAERNTPARETVETTPEPETAPSRLPDIGSRISSKGPAVNAPANNLECENKQAFLKWPLDGARVQTFYGSPRNGVPNQGIDISSPADNLVKSVFEGRVVDVLPQGNELRTIVVKHSENYYTVYGDLKFANVAPGDEINTQQLIGLASSSGGEFILHFEVRKDQQAVNPRHWLKNN